MASRSLRTTNSNIPNSSPLVDTLARHVECCICMAVLHNAASCTPCLHTFCIGCIAKWNETNNGKCPMCRVSVKDVSPNWVMRDLVNSYLQMKPALQRTEEEKEELDRSELTYIVKWLGETNEKLLYIESLASLRGAPENGDQKTSAMKNRALELFKKFLGAEKKPVPEKIVKKELDKLIEDVHKEIYPATLFLKYHRLERAYKHLVRISVPVIGPNEHTWLGNYYFDTACTEVLDELSDESFEDSDEEEFDLNLPNRIAEALTIIRHPDRRRPPRATVGGFDPTVLEALARVQTMRAPGFNRSSRFNTLPMTSLQEIVNDTRPLPPRARRLSSLYQHDMEAIPEQVPMLTRRHARRSEATASSRNPSPPPNPRR
ncbi:unnamed protein product [Caenorhabditis brenneri]